jgi:hypothetical protein
LETRVEAETEKKVDFAWVATALASIVFCQKCWMMEYFSGSRGPK